MQFSYYNDLISIDNQWQEIYIINTFDVYQTFYYIIHDDSRFVDKIVYWAQH